MKKSATKALLPGALLFVLLIAPGLRTAKGVGPTPAAVLEMQGRQALEDWDYKKAGEIAASLLKMAEAKDATAETKLTARTFRGLYFFYQGDYARAVPEFDEAAKITPLPTQASRFHERCKALAKLWKDAPKKSSAHFVVNWADARDEVLAEPALMVLEQAYTVLTRDLKVLPGDPVRVEIYPSFDDFSAATGLSLDDLENSGTIAVCKYRRLMLNSPRILALGYTFRDTLSHEFVHFLIFQRFKSAVPIWLHEGLAKYLETRWRGGDEGKLLPSQSSLLASALRMNELITFDRMHPSFAKLKDPKQGQLAFAEVHSTVAFLVKMGGWDLVFKLCAEMGNSPDYRSAVARATGMPFDVFWQNWIAFAKKQGYKELPGMEITVYEIRKGEDASDEEDDVDASDLAEGEEWKYVRLGDLLRQRGHAQAAIVEYKKALEIAPYNPRILNKLGQTQCQAGDCQAALAPLSLAAEMSPGFSSTYLNLGRALLVLGKVREGEKALLTLLEINPFNPIPYPILAGIYEKEKRTVELKKVLRDYAIITGGLPPEEIGRPAERKTADK